MRTVAERLQAAVDRLAALQDRIEAAQAEGAWTAVARLEALAERVRTEIDDLHEAAAQAEPAAAEMSAEVLAARVVALIAQLPDHLIDLIEDALDERRGTVHDLDDEG